MEYLHGFIAGALAYPASLSPPMLLIVLLVGIFLLGQISDFFGFLILLGLGYLLLGGVTVLMVAFAGGVLPWALLVLIAAVFFYDFGRTLVRKRYSSFNYHLILLVVLSVVFCRSYFLMTWEDAVEWTLIAAVAYIAIGIVVALAKWRGYNVAAFETILDRQASLLADWARTAQKKAASSIQEDSRNRSRNRDDDDDADKPFTEEESRALLALIPASKDALRKMDIPEPLTARWTTYRRRHSDMTMPKLIHSKALFMSWVFGWPGVMMFWVLHDLVEVLTNGIYRMVSSVLRRIQLNVVGKRTDLLD